MLHVTSAILFGVEQPEFAWKVGDMIDRWVEMNHDTAWARSSPIREINARYDRAARIRRLARGRNPRRWSALRRETHKPADDVLSLLIRANEFEHKVYGRRDDRPRRPALWRRPPHHSQHAHLDAVPPGAASGDHAAAAPRDHRRHAGGLPDVRRDDADAVHRAGAQGEHADSAGVVLFAADLRGAHDAPQRAAESGHARGLQPVRHAPHARVVSGSGGVSVRTAGSRDPFRRTPICPLARGRRCASELRWRCKRCGRCCLRFSSATD